MNSSLVRPLRSRGVAVRVFALWVLVAMMVSYAGAAYATAPEVPQPAGPSEEYDPDPSPDVVGGPGSEEFLPYTEDPQPAGPSEEYETGPSLDVVGGPGNDADYMPYTEDSAPLLASATKTAPAPYLPFTGANSAIAAGLISLIGASGFALRRLACKL
jgi:hypothetical protein